MNTQIKGLYNMLLEEREKELKDVEVKIHYHMYVKDFYCNRRNKLVNHIENLKIGLDLEKNLD